MSYVRKIVWAAVGAVAMAPSVGAQAAPVYDAANGHYYEYISDPSITNFQTAMAFAASQTYQGLTGYLATITSDAENQFVFQNVSGGSGNQPGYGGGTDDQSIGIWKWVTGPEAGTTFYIEGAPTQPGYSNWNPGEPNNTGNENYLNLFNNSPSGWNNIPNSPNAIYVEFGGLAAAVPEPSTWVMMMLGFAGLGFFACRKTPTVRFA